MTIDAGQVATSVEVRLVERFRQSLVLLNVTIDVSHVLQMLLHNLLSHLIMVSFDNYSITTRRVLS